MINGGIAFIKCVPHLAPQSIAAHVCALLATVCPSILFPYSRESLDALVVKGSFPPLMIAPINFEALYAQQKQAAEQQAAGGEAAPESVQ